MMKQLPQAYVAPYLSQKCAFGSAISTYTYTGYWFRIWGISAASPARERDFSQPESDCPAKGGFLGNFTLAQALPKG